MHPRLIAFVRRLPIVKQLRWWQRLSWRADHLQANQALLTTLADKGLIRTDLNLNAVALTLRALDFGWVLEELNDHSDVEFEDWVAVMRELAHTLATPRPT